MTSLSQTIEIPLRPVSIDNMSLQKMGFIMNALEKGWTVKKRDDSYVFSKKHEGKKEIFMEDIFAVIGKMYLDLLQSQKIIESLQKKLEDRENDISSLQASIISKDNIM